MKKYIILFTFLGLSLILSTSCMEEYLDKAPESGLTTEEVFSRHDNFKKFFYAVYEGRKQYNGWDEYNIKNAYYLRFNTWDQKYTWEGLTDWSESARYMEGHSIKSGQISSIINKFTYDGDRKPILESMFLCIRICNITLQNIHLLKDVEQVEIDDYMAQAHFVRAYCHFELFRIWGPMPYLTKPLNPGDQYDIPRLSKFETLTSIAADLDTAVSYFEKAGRMRRDPGPGITGHLNDPNQARPNGVAAKALKARALLYAASPLNNDKGQKAWEDAAVANWEALQEALKYNYALMSFADYKRNYVNSRYTNEQLWGWYAGNWNHTNGNLQCIQSAIFHGSTGSTFGGESPTQNAVDKFETRWGDPLTTQAERDDAVALGHYNEQDPYANRDPRLTIDILYNQAPNLTGWTGGKAQIYFEMKNGSPVYSELLNQSYLSWSRTGYYNRKTWGEKSSKNQGNVDYTASLIRLAELYLNYAEAANEAYGPNTAAPGATLTALQAVNLIRARVNMPEVLAKYTGNKDDFRARVKNERVIELCFEGHYFHDIRRWKDAPKAYAGPIYGMSIEKVPVSASYPTGFKYTRALLGAERQTQWKEAMYYFPFNTEDNYKMKNFVPNEVW
ncbi:MAG: RagB/SusD family nutrient uptake outer membrane protein [Bacteroidetes bacterium]|nr:RagB/SusD family nutrient uptake outer membrane protein [Bacteroidota bacterium]